MKVQIIEDETFIDKADFDNCEVWLLNRTQTTPLDSRVINEELVTESLHATNYKFPMLFSEIAKKHFTDGVIPTDFYYEILTSDTEHYAIHTYVCDVSKIKVVN